MNETFSLARSVLYRFIRGGIAGAVSTAASVTVFAGVETWTDLRPALAALALMGIIGFITGGLLAADKFIRSRSSESLFETDSDL